MNSREIVLDAFDLKEPERVPTALFGGGAWIIFDSGNSFFSFKGRPEKYADVILKAQEKLDSDIVYVGSGYNNFHAAALGGRIKVREVGPPDLEAPIVTGSNDLERLDINGVDRDEFVAMVRKATGIVAEEIGDETLVTTTSWGPFTLGAQLRGVEALMLGIYNEPELVKQVVDFSGEVISRFYEPLIEDGVIEVVSIADPTASGDLVSRKHFRDFALPSLQRLIKEFKAKGVRTLLHICGNTSDKIDLIAESGADCFSIDCKVDIGYAKEQLRGEMCLAGNVDPVGIMGQGTAEDVSREAGKCIDAAASKGGYILMPGCDIPPMIPFENIRALIQTAKHV